MPPAVSDLIVPERTAGYVKGRETRELILRTALNILIEHGWQAMSMRRIAADCGMKFGNLTYHYRTREDLVRELLDAVISSYEREFDTLVERPDLSPEERLDRYCQLVLDDISAKKTTPLKGSPPTWTLTISPSSTTTELTSASPNLTTPFLAIADQSSNALTLTPSAAAAAYNYDCILYADDTAVTITPTATSGTIYVNGIVVATGIASGSISIPVTVAERTIFVVVVTSNDVPTVYRIRFIRGIANHP